MSKGSLVSITTYNEDRFIIHIIIIMNILSIFFPNHRTIRQSSSRDDDIHRYPSAPNLCEDDGNAKPNVSKTSAIAVRRSSCLPKFRNRVPPTLVRQAMSIDCSSSSPFLPNPQRPFSLNQPSVSASSSNPNVRGGNYVKLRKGVHRTVTNTSTNSENYYNLGSGSAEICSPNSQSTSQAASTLSVDNSGSSEVTVKRVTSGASTHFNSGTVDLHLPNGMVTLNVIHTTGGSMLGGSSTCLRTLSPHPSYHSQSADSCSFDMGSVQSDNVLFQKSPMKPYYKFRSESFGRPTLVRQSKVDQTEIIYIPDSDEEQQPIPEEEHESDSDAG